MNIPSNNLMNIPSNNQPKFAKIDGGFIQISQIADVRICSLGGPYYDVRADGIGSTFSVCLGSTKTRDLANQLAERIMESLLTQEGPIIDVTSIERDFDKEHEGCLEEDFFEPLPF